MDPLPFTLALSPHGVWFARWATHSLMVRVADENDSPHPDLLATLQALVSEWPTVVQSVGSFVRGLAPDTPIPLQPPLSGHFTAQHCGFQEELCLQALVLDEPSTPLRAALSFYTGYPDGYATFEITLVGGKPQALSAYAS